MNKYVEALDMEFDDEGKVAASGTINKELLEELHK